MSFFSKKKMSPREDPDSFGNVAIQLGLITQADLEAAISAQEQRLPLGEILVKQGKLTDLQKEQVLLEQEKRKAKTKEEVVDLEMRWQTLIIKQMKNHITDLAESNDRFTSVIRGATK